MSNLSRDKNIQNNFKDDIKPAYFNLCKLNTNIEEYQKCIDTCVKALSKDGVIAIPTDTIYGVGCILSSNKAVQKIYEIKNRDLSKPLAVCVSEINMVYKWSKCPLTFDQLKLFLPGKCTLIFERSNFLYNHLNPNSNSIGIRMIDDDFINNLCNCLPEKSLVLTSANISQQLSSIWVNDFKEIAPFLDIIIDKGKPISNNFSRLGSTVIDLATNIPNSFKIIRIGDNYDKYREILLNVLKYKEL